MSRLKPLIVIRNFWLLFWFSMIAYTLWCNGASAAPTSEPVPVPPNLSTSVACALYSSVIVFNEPTKDVWGRPLGGSGKQAFYGCAVNYVEVDELGNALGSSSVVGLPPSGPAGGGTILIPIPAVYKGKMIKVDGYCVNGYGLGLKAASVLYFVKQ